MAIDNTGQVDAPQVEVLKHELYAANCGRTDYPAFDEDLGNYQALFSQYDIDFLSALQELAYAGGIFIDFGCGTGQALRNAQAIFGNRISQYIGITAEGTGQSGSDGITIIEGDLQDPANLLQKVLPAERVEPFTGAAVYLTRYLADPFAFLEGLYNLMRQGDRAYIFEFPLALVRAGENMLDEDGVQRLTEYLAQYGIEIIRRSGVFQNVVIIKKMSNGDIHIPVEWERIEQRAHRLLYRVSNGLTGEIN